MIRTALYQSKKVYVNYVSQNGTLLLISYTNDDNKSFKVDVNELTELNFKIEVITS